jgi:hypothetical protein
MVISRHKFGSDHPVVGFVGGSQAVDPGVHVPVVEVGETKDALKYIVEALPVHDLVEG